MKVELDDKTSASVRINGALNLIEPGYCQQINEHVVLNCGGQLRVQGVGYFHDRGAVVDFLVGRRARLTQLTS